MKLQISFELTNLSDALNLAKKTYKFADVLEVGTLLLYKEGIKAIEVFKKEFPNKEILADAKICDHTKTAVELFASAGADIITVLAGTNNEEIQIAVKTAHSLNKKIALDLFGSYSTGQSALDAEYAGVDSLVFIRKEQTPYVAADWGATRANTKLPITVTGSINKDNITQILQMHPQAISIGRAVTTSLEPDKIISEFYDMVKGL